MRRGSEKIFSSQNKIRSSPNSCPSNPTASKNQCYHHNIIFSMAILGISWTLNEYWQIKISVQNWHQNVILSFRETIFVVRGCSQKVADCEVLYEVLFLKLVPFRLFFISLSFNIERNVLKWRQIILEMVAFRYALIKIFWEEDFHEIDLDRLYKLAEFSSQWWV